MSIKNFQLIRSKIKMKMNYQQAFFEVIVLLPIDPGKRNMYHLQVLLLPPGLGAGTHIYTSMKRQNGVKFHG